MTSIASALFASRNNITDYCLYIEEAGTIAQLRDSTGGIRGLGKVDKIYLDNTNLIYNLANENSNSGNIRETFFLNQHSVKYDVIDSAIADCQIGDYTFQVGGKNKGLKQIQGKDWNDLKKKLQKEGRELSEKIGQLKISAPDGKKRLTDVASTDQLFRLIQSIPSSKAEPFKLWISQLTKESN